MRLRNRLTRAVGKVLRPAPPLFATPPLLPPSRTLDDYHDLLTYMGQRLGRPIRLYQRGTYAEVNDLLKNREIDLAFVCAGAFVYGERDFWVGGPGVAAGGR